MLAITVLVVFLVGYAISMFSMKMVIEKKGILWCMPPIAYGSVAGAVDSMITGRPFDSVAVLAFVTTLLVLGWATAKYEL